MDPQLQQALARVLDEMIKAAEAIGVQGIRLWPQLVGLTFVTSVFKCGVASLVGLFLLYAMFAYPKRLFAWNKTLTGEDAGWGIAFAVVSVVACIFGLAGVVSVIGSNIGGIFFPEAQTVLNLLEKAGATVKK